MEITNTLPSFSFFSDAIPVFCVREGLCISICIRKRPPIKKVSINRSYQILYVVDNTLTLQSSISLRNYRFSVSAGIITAFLGVTLSIVVVGADTRVLVQNITIICTSGAAFAFSLATLISSDVKYRKIFSMFVVGLGLWFVAEVVWTYYVQVLGVEIPFPSFADVFYFAGYLFVGIFLLKIVRMLAQVNQRNILVISTVSISLVAFLMNFFILDLVRASFAITSLSADEVMLLAFSVAYPILDSFLIIPSLIILYESRSQPSRYFSWILLSLAMVSFGIADTGFGYTALKNIEVLADEALWDVIFNLGYMLFAGALFYEFVKSRKEKKGLKK